MCKIKLVCRIVVLVTRKEYSFCVIVTSMKNAYLTYERADKCHSWQ